MTAPRNTARNVAACRAAREAFEDALRTCSATPPNYGALTGLKLGGKDTVNAAALKAWMDMMYAWGCGVRQDILRLEVAAGLSLGDPGDPPPPPQM